MVHLAGSQLENENFSKNDEKEKVYKWEIVWINVILLGLLHIGAVYSLFLRSETLWSTVIIAKLFAILTGLGVTGGAHRLWAHKSYKANTFVQCLLTFLITCTYQNSIYIWARDHRLHHKYSETDADPHNAKRGFFFSHVGWLLMRKHPEVREKGKTINMSDLKSNPIVMFQHRFYFPLVLLGTIVFPMCICHYGFGENLKNAFFVAVVYRYIWSIHFVWCINSVAHMYGNRPYNKRINPTENLLTKYTGFGEGFHNYHHTFPWDYKTGEFHNDSRNLTAFMIDTFAKNGWVTDLKTAHPESIKRFMNKMGDNTVPKKPNLLIQIKDGCIFLALLKLLF